MTRSWISDTPDEIEHPPIPLGLNKMAVPRATIVLSVITGIGLLLSSVWVGISAIGFLDEMDTVFGTTDTAVLNEDGRWLWEVGLLFDTCSPREDDWEWPHGSLSEQEGVFLLPARSDATGRTRAMETRPVWSSTIERIRPSIWCWR